MSRGVHESPKIFTSIGIIVLPRIMEKRSDYGSAENKKTTR